MKSVLVKKITCYLLVALFLLAQVAFAKEPTQTATHPVDGPMKFNAGQIVVKLKEGISKSKMQSLLRAGDVSILDERGDFGLTLLSVPKGQELEKAEELMRSPSVEYAEPNYIVQAASSIKVDSLYNLHALDVEPNDPYYPGQWNLHKINAPTGWDITTGSSKVVIAILSTGVDPDHDELKEKIWTNSNEVPGNGIDDDGNGYVDDVHGWDFILENWDNEPWDDRGNGTFAAAVAAAETNNGVGLAGVSWGARIMPIKVLDFNGGGDIYEITSAIRYAADNGARVLLLDFIVFDYSHTLEAFIEDAYKKGALVIAPMGDCAEGGQFCRELINPVLYPAAFPHVLAVAATDQNDEHYFISGHKSYSDIAAPGVNILGGHLASGYGRMSSTHAASPHVAGLAALVWSVNPTLTPDEVESIIEGTAVDLGEPGWDEYFGHGRIDANAAVRATPHYLEVEPDEGLYFLVCDNCDPSPQKIINPNTGCCTWSATATANWLSIGLCEGYTPSSVEVSVDRDNLSGYGLYSEVITVTSEMTNYVNNPKTIPAIVNYAPQCWRNYLPLLFKDSH